jgi:hypothetical protein
MTRSSWRDLGGIAGALDGHASAIARAVEDGGLASEVDIKRVMLSLVTPAGARVSRTLKELMDGRRDAEAAAVLSRFEEARLLVREASRGAREQDRLTLAHEALLTHWGKLRAWVAEEREERVLREDLAQAAALWAKSGDDELLWRRRRLLLAQEVLRRRGVRLQGDEERFFQASMWAARRGRLGLLALGAVAIMAFVGGMGAYAYMLDLRARAAQAEAQMMRERAEKAEALLGRSEALQKVKVAEEEAAKAVLLYEQIKSAMKVTELAAPARAFTGTPEPSLPRGLVDEVEDYLLAQQRQNEPVPELLKDVLPEVIVAPPESDDDGEPDVPQETAMAPTSAPAPSVAPQAFRSLPLGAAYAALRGAQAKVATCRSADGPRGAGRLVVVIAPEGRVASVVLERPFAGTTVGRCVEGAFRQILIHPFEGKPVTVLWSFLVP